MHLQTHSNPASSIYPEAILLARSIQNLVLEQVNRNAGAASSLLVFMFFILGAISMWIISFDWRDKIQVIGILATGVGVIMLSLWSFLANQATNK